VRKKTFYITTTLPYVNADPHIGFALEIVQADVISRLKRLLGYQVIFNTGTDEHGLKIYSKALKEGKDPQKYCDQYASKFNDLKPALNLSYTNFIRTTDPSHKQAAQEFWRRCNQNGDIYKKNYQIKYCVGCELEKTDSELIKGRCPLHPKQKLEIIEEENYFFRFSKYQDKLLRLYEKNKDFVLPQKRFNEIKSFVKKGLKDFSISRLKSKMPWGIDVPGDPHQVMYVWFDALINYISTLGWPENTEKFALYWPAIQLAGKDNLRQQTAMWQAMLMSAGLPNSKQIVIHGFVTANGQKMSKSLGNVVNPFDLVGKYKTDAVRYYLLREIPSLDDGDYSPSRMKEVYNSDLANELGNLVSRLTNLAEKDNLFIQPTTIKFDRLAPKKYFELIDQYLFDEALKLIWQKIKKMDKQVDDFAPWKKVPSERLQFLNDSLTNLNSIGHLLIPFMPQTAEKIIKATQGQIHKTKPLFPK